MSSERELLLASMDEDWGLARAKALALMPYKKNQRDEATLRRTDLMMEIYRELRELRKRPLAWRSNT